eukprot:gene8077-1319_t
MSATEVLAPPSNYPTENASQNIDGVYGSLPGLFQVPHGHEASSTAGSWRAGSAKANQLALSAALDAQAETQEVVDLDNFAQPVDHGPAAGGAEVQRLLKSWQYQRQQYCIQHPMTLYLPDAAVLHPVPDDAVPPEIQQYCNLYPITP